MKSKKTKQYFQTYIAQTLLNVEGKRVLGKCINIKGFKQIGPSCGKWK